MLYVDIPTTADLARLAGARGEVMVSLYIPTTPETQHISLARTELGNLLKVAEEQLEAAEVPKRSIWPISEQINDLLDDDDFWAHQANSLAIFVTPEGMRHYRLPNHLKPLAQVADRYYLKPLMRSVTAGAHAFVLALAENEVRLIEVFADLPAAEVKVPDLPKDAAAAVGTASVNSRSYSGRIGGGEGQNTLLRSFCRKVDAALRPILAGRDEPLILAATDPLQSLYRSVGGHPTLVEAPIHTSPVRMTPAELAAEARPILDNLLAAELADLRALFDRRAAEGRGTTDIAQAARSATYQAVETIMVDIDQVVPGTIDEVTGEVTFATEKSAATYGIVDEIAARVMAGGGRVVAVRRADIPGEASLAAILRYAI